MAAGAAEAEGPRLLDNSNFSQNRETGRKSLAVAAFQRAAWAAAVSNNSSLGGRGKSSEAGAEGEDWNAYPEAASKQELTLEGATSSLLSNSEGYSARPLKR